MQVYIHTFVIFVPQKPPVLITFGIHCQNISNQGEPHEAETENHGKRPFHPMLSFNYIIHVELVTFHLRVAQYVGVGCMRTSVWTCLYSWMVHFFIDKSFKSISSKESHYTEFFDIWLTHLEWNYWPLTKYNQYILKWINKSICKHLPDMNALDFFA